MQRGGSVIHGVAAPVIAHGAALGQRLWHPPPSAAAFRPCGTAACTEQLHGIDGLAHIAAAGRGDRAGHLRPPTIRRPAASATS